MDESKSIPIFLCCHAIFDDRSLKIGSTAIPVASLIDYCFYGP